MKNAILSLLLIFLILPAYGQVEKKSDKDDKRRFFHISGNTMNDSLDAIPYVHIILKNKNLATASDIQGYFNFPTEVNDTLVFTAIGYQMQTFIVKDTFPTEYPYMEVFLVGDTIQLKELIITPWQGDYERFKAAVLAYDPPETQMDRAYKNLEILDLHALLYDSPATPNVAFRNSMKTYNDNLYWAGQLPPVNITNPLAWAQFFKALKNGDLKLK